MIPPPRLLLRGADHARFGEVTTVALGRSAGAISAGGDRLDGARGAKQGMAVPNEDALLIVERGSRTLLAVADAHWGHESSHVLLERLANTTGDGELPDGVPDLQRVVAGLADPADEPTASSTDVGDSETTLLVAVVDHAERQLFAVGFGDSGLFVARRQWAGFRVTRHDRPDHHYVSPRTPATLAARHASTLEVELATGDIVMLCTDGVHECRYHDPAHSLGTAELAAVFAGGGSPEDLADRVAAAALAGIPGWPGGQDNLAIALTRA